MQEPEVALANSEFIYYRSANYTVEQNKESSLYGNPAVYSNAKTYNILKIYRKAQMSLKTGCGQKSKAGSFQPTVRSRTENICAMRCFRRCGNYCNYNKNYK